MGEDKDSCNANNDAAGSVAEEITNSTNNVNDSGHGNPSQEKERNDVSTADGEGNPAVASTSEEPIDDIQEVSRKENDSPGEDHPGVSGDNEGELTATTTSDLHQSGSLLDIEPEKDNNGDKDGDDDDPGSSKVSGAEDGEEGEISKTSSKNNEESFESIAQSKGAQILMNRFSSWKQKATLANLKETAKSVAPVTMTETSKWFSSAKAKVSSGTRKLDDHDEDSDGNNSFVQMGQSDSEEDGGSESNSDSDSGSSMEEEGTATSDCNCSASSVNESDKEKKIGEDAKQSSFTAIASAAATAAASNVAESVATGFRGRYSSSTAAAAVSTPSGKQRNSSEKNVEGKPIDTPTKIQSQTSLIMQSAIANKLQSIVEGLEPHEYVMLHKAGMLGVNLKQTYLRNNGVYVDYYVDGGAADMSGVVYAGDRIVKVGDVDVQRGTILDVPQTIADAKRPSIIVLASGFKIKVEMMNYIDMAISMMHKVREDATNSRRDIASMPISPQNTKDFEEEAKIDKDRKTESEEVKYTKNIEEEVGKTGEEDAGSTEAEETKHVKEEKTESPDAEDIKDTATEAKRLGNENKEVDDPVKSGGVDNPKPMPVSSAQDTESIPVHSFTDDYINMNPPDPPLASKEAMQHFVSRRCNDNFSISMLAHAAESDDNFRAALRNAFIVCSLDGRRLPFLANFLSKDENSYSPESQDNPSIESPPQTTESKQLMLYCELMSFSDLFGVTPVSRRRDIAKRIASKFFLPSSLGGQIQSPMFDFHQIVPESVLHGLEKALNADEKPIEQKLFAEFQEAVVNLLAGAPFIDFLASDECSRMRAYLSNTAPYVQVSVRDVFDAVAGKNATDGKESSPADNDHIAAGHNLFLYMLVHLLCQTEGEVGSENDDIIYGVKDRVIGGPGGIACAVFIKRDLVVAIQNAKAFAAENSGWPSSATREIKPITDLVEVFEHFWLVFAAPDVGALDSISNSNETTDALVSVRDLLHEAISFPKDADEADRRGNLVEKLTSVELLHALNSLSEELLYDYAANINTKFREHKFHEWMCKEASKECQQSLKDIANGMPRLPFGCITRLFRKAELPFGVSAHKPMLQGSAARDEESAGEISLRLSNPNADYAIVFGSDDGLNTSNRIHNPAMENSDIRRYICRSVAVDGGKKLEEKFIPPTLESYATVPKLRKKPFSAVVDENRVSADGWEISLVNFMIPGEEDNSVFGVSLVFQKVGESEGNDDPQKDSIELVYEEPLPETPETPEKPTCKGGETVYDTEGNAIDVGEFASPISFISPKPDTKDSDATHEQVAARKIKMTAKTPKYINKFSESNWTDRVTNYRSSDSSDVTIGIALISGNNNVVAMRDTLSRLLLDHGRVVDNNDENSEEEKQLICRPLIELLGAFSHENVESVALKCILEPYLKYGSSPWMDQPLRNQAAEFMNFAGQQLINSLPPIPLALLFVTVLLEQKIVLSSSRRSILFSAVTAITELLKPLKWSHLLVPMAPSALARDLVNYPAPFILGIPSEDPGSMELLNSLPNDVTLVDLDVGRVILAQSIIYEDGAQRGNTDAENTARALRSQTLYFAQALGVLFGSCLHEKSWCSDSPVGGVTKNAVASSRELSNFDNLKRVCRDFLLEFLGGTTSCCYWIEEKCVAKQGTTRAAKSTECTVLFDEDRFFHIKNIRAAGKFMPFLDRKKSLFPISYSKEESEKFDTTLQCNTSLALSIDDFDLIFECFLRCQSMSTFISSCSKRMMAYY